MRPESKNSFKRLSSFALGSFRSNELNAKLVYVDKLIEHDIPSKKKEKHIVY